MDHTNCVAYVRVSSVQQEETGLSLDTQKMFVKEEADSRGLTIDYTFEYTMSGFREDNLLQFSRDLRSSGYAFDTELTVIVYTMNRFCRNIINFEKFLKKWPNLILICAHRRMEMRTEEDRALFRCDIVNSQLESEKISRRVRASIDYRKRTGTYYPPVRSVYGQSRKRERETGEIIETAVDEEQTVISFIKLMCVEPKLARAEELALEIGIRLEDEDSPKLSFSSANSASLMADFLNHHEIYRNGNLWTPNYVRRFVNEAKRQRVDVDKADSDMEMDIPIPGETSREVERLIAQLRSLGISKDAVLQKVHSHME